MRAALTTGLVAALLLGAGQSHAGNKDYLSCDKGLRLPSCTAVTGLWPVATKLHVVVKCETCIGGGGTCTATAVKASDLSVETAGGVAVSGSFAAAGSCSGLPLFKFGGTLKPSTNYRVVATIGAFGATALIDFKTSSGGSTTNDSGVKPKTDGGGATKADGGATPDSGSAPGTDSHVAGDGQVAGDSGGTGVDGPGGEEDGGCGCLVAAGGGLRALPLLLLLLAALALHITVRRRPG
jgi:hypothetical protein